MPNCQGWPNAARSPYSTTGIRLNSPTFIFENWISREQPSDGWVRGRLCRLNDVVEKSVDRAWYARSEQWDDACALSRAVPSLVRTGPQGFPARPARGPPAQPSRGRDGTPATRVGQG